MKEDNIGFININIENKEYNISWSYGYESAKLSDSRRYATFDSQHKTKLFVETNENGEIFLRDVEENMYLSWSVGYEKFKISSGRYYATWSPRKDNPVTFYEDPFNNKIYLKNSDGMYLSWSIGYEELNLSDNRKYATWSPLMDTPLNITQNLLIDTIKIIVEKTNIIPNNVQNVTLNSRTVDNLYGKGKISNSISLVSTQTEETTWSTDISTTNKINVSISVSSSANFGFASGSVSTEVGYGLEKTVSNTYGKTISKETTFSETCEYVVKPGYKEKFELTAKKGDGNIKWSGKSYYYYKNKLIKELPIEGNLKAVVFNDVEIKRFVLEKKLD